MSVEAIQPIREKADLEQAVVDYALMKKQSVVKLTFSVDEAVADVQRARLAAYASRHGAYSKRQKVSGVPGGWTEPMPDLAAMLRDCMNGNFIHKSELVGLIQHIMHRVNAELASHGIKLTAGKQALCTCSAIADPAEVVDKKAHVRMMARSARPTRLADPTPPI